MTDIEWTDKTWNPTTGCDKVSAGCDNCYALRMAGRLKGMGQAKYQRDGDPRTSGPGFALTMHPDTLDLPMRWRKPAKVFVNSMSDLFHPKVTDLFLAQVFAVMATTPHTYQVLTKRAPRMRALLNSGDFLDTVAYLLDANDIPAPRWPLPNVWLGVSVEDQAEADRRIPALLGTPAAVRWISAEPLLGPVNLWHWIDPSEPDADCTACGEEVFRTDSGGHPVRHFCRDDTCGPTGCDNEGGDAGTWCDGAPIPHPVIDWVVAGGESGPDARPMHPDWARQLRDQCQAAGVPYLFKQWGEWRPLLNGEYPPPGPTTTIHIPGQRMDKILTRVGKKAAGRKLDGRTWDEYPTTRQAVPG